MDVQAAATSAPTPVPVQPTLPPAAHDPSPAPDPGAGTDPSASGTTAGTTPAVTGIPGATNGAASNQATDDTLSPVVAKLFNTAEQNVEVSFQVLHNPDEVVTVFTDKATGKEIVQFPSQALVALAEMYDKDAGNVLDKSV
jgi:uncharacterized FlaG/YvyC family protein